MLVVWCLKTPLTQLMDILGASVVDACRKVHKLWGIREPRDGYADTYDLSTWMMDQRFQAKAGQNAHGSESEIALWFLCRRRKVDWGWRGQQTYSAYLFEQCSRATLRQMSL